jgi:hypothetical protein
MESISFNLELDQISPVVKDWAWLAFSSYVQVHHRSSPPSNDVFSQLSPFRSFSSGSSPCRLVARLCMRGPQIFIKPSLIHLTQHGLQLSSTPSPSTRFPSTEPISARIVSIEHCPTLGLH